MRKIWFLAFDLVELVLPMCSSVLEKRAGIRGRGSSHGCVKRYLIYLLE
jgi:hypothetical protein